MIHTRVVNRSRRVGYDVYVGRPSVWGNRYVTKAVADQMSETEKSRFIIVKDVVEALEGYDSFLKLRVDLVERARTELRGKVLACWCVDDLTGKGPIVCHAQILARVADGYSLPIFKAGKTWTTSERKRFSKR